MIEQSVGAGRSRRARTAADDLHGTAHWRAYCPFTETGRPVTEHCDRFSFHAWSRQALGPVGLLLGWTPLLRAAIRKKAAARLAEYEAERAG